MFLHEMTVAERLESIIRIASKLTGAPANVSFDTHWPSLVVGCDDPPIVAPRVPLPYTEIRVLAVGARPRPGQSGTTRKWKLSTPGTHTEEAVVGVLSHAMLLSLAHDAQVCPRCRESLARQPGGGRHKCSCRMVVVESG